jgi:hypothetical protein
MWQICDEKKKRETFESKDGLWNIMRTIW